MELTTPDQLRELVAAHAGTKAADLTWETRLVHDLGIDGDNFYELLEDIHRRFGTDLQGLWWTDYAPSEGELLNGWPGKTHLVAQCRPMTLRMLYDAINAGAWIETSEEPHRRVISPPLIYIVQLVAGIGIAVLAGLFLAALVRSVR